MSFKLRSALVFALLVVAAAGYAGEKAAGIEIVAAPKTGKGPMWVHIEPKVNNLKEPLKFMWYFGDGNESEEMVPKPHYYDVGKFNLLLEVTEKTGKVYTASVTIDAVSPG
ncbi:MAG: PKD domain-containing protein [Nitrospirae bacterium]|nr:PKD domain-containing protein [Nitrospirota bacterium]MCL5237083.1 PKD domain-containing protein [Nitrospirota bacterium]